MTWNMGNARPTDGWVDTVFPDGAASYDVVAFGMQESTYSHYPGKEDATNRDSLGEEAEVEMEADDTWKDRGHDHDTEPGPPPAQPQRAMSSRVRKTSVVQSMMMPCINDVQEMILEGLPDFDIVEHAHRAQMQLYVLARRSIIPHISDVSIKVENTGFAHVFPNKGGLLVDFTAYGTSMAFISCHLTAHEGVKNCEMRNNSVAEILGGVRAGDTRFDVSGQRHHVFFMGDMNYRLTSDPAVPHSSARNESISIEELQKFRAQYDNLEKDLESEGTTEPCEHRSKVEALLLQNDWARLMQMDELNREITDNRCLKGFTALTPDFPPTFKRLRNIGIEEPASDLTTDSFATYYHHKRCPSYTDRILHRSMPNFEGHLRAESFVSFESLISSDHKPVRATFQLRLTDGPRGILVPHVVQEHLHKNLISKIIKDKHGVELVISHMSCKDLAEMDVDLGFGIGGLSDPYLLVTTDPVNLLATKKPIMSTIITHNINPVWPEEETVHVPLLSNDLEGMRSEAHLFVSVWDYDFSNDDDLIGLCRVPLAKILQEGGCQLTDEPLYENGEIQGYITCKISPVGSLEKISKAHSAARGTAVTLDNIEVPEDASCAVCACNIA